MDSTTPNLASAEPAPPPVGDAVLSNIRYKSWSAWTAGTNQERDEEEDIERISVSEILKSLE